MKSYKIKISRASLVDYIYFLLEIMVFFFAISNSMFTSVFPAVTKILAKSLILFRMLFIILAIIELVYRGIKGKDILFITVYPIFFMLSYLTTHSWDIFDALFIAVFFTRTLEYEKVIKAFLRPLIISLAVIATSYFIGLFPVFQIFRPDGTYRLSMGYVHPNDLSRILLFISILYILKKADQTKKADIILLFAISLFVFLFPNSRDVSYCLIIFCILILARTASIRYLKKDIFLLRKTRFLYLWLFWLITVILWILCLNVKYDDILHRIAASFYSRFYLARRGLNEYGISLFGHQIQFAAEYALRFSNNSNLSYFTLDSVYFYLPIARGILPSIYIMLLYSTNIYITHKRKNTFLLFVLMVIVLYSISEPGITYFIGSFIFILPRLEKQINAHSI